MLGNCQHGAWAHRQQSLCRQTPSCLAAQPAMKHSSLTSASWCTRLHPCSRKRRRCCQAAAQEEPAAAEIPLRQLSEQLGAAVEAEDYLTAAKLRDELSRRRQDQRVAVEEANNLFYAAFQACSIKGMEEIWGEGEHVQVMHPATECISGREHPLRAAGGATSRKDCYLQVLSSWRMVLRGEFSIHLEDLRIYATDRDAFVTCVEVINAEGSVGRTAATNVFEKQGDVWKIVHHHGGPVPTRRVLSKEIEDSL